MRKLTTLLVAILALTTTAAVPAHAAGRIVLTDTGPVAGTVSERHRTFQGIPFAAPPVGELRWRDPQPVRPWTTPRDATTPGPRCAQTAQLGNPASSAEDCLYLNVTTPRGVSRPRPVMVWLHGGGYTSGAGSDYDARRLVTGAGVVVVTINYRLGAFANFAYPSLAGSGTFGLADQQAALRWVQRNARAFGGDPGNITAVGESAGGFSICGHLTSPGAAGLFRRAIIQSGACTIDFPIPGGTSVHLYAARRDTEAAGTRFHPTCPDIACLRRLPVEALLNPATTRPFGRPSYDTALLPRHPVEALRDGHFHRVPVLIGTNRHEGTLFTVFDHPEPVPPQTYLPTLTRLYGAARAEQIAARYPLDYDDDARPELAAALNDRAWSCTTDLARRQFARRTTVHGYEFADTDVPMYFPDLPPFPYLAFHAAELPFLFDQEGVTVELSPAQRRLSEQMIGMWGRYAATGDPGWRRHPVVQSLAPGAVRPVDFAREHQCGFWF